MMASVTVNRVTKRVPICYVVIDFRSERFRTHYCRKAEAGGNFAQEKPKIVIIKAKLLTKNCLPTKVKRSESSGVAWRRKSNPKAKHSSRRSSTPPNVRPTLLLPPMRCTTAGGIQTEENGNTVPVVTTRVQQNDGTQIRDGFLSLDNSPRCYPLPEPSAPSPGHLFYNSEDHSDIAFIVGQEEWRFPAHSFILGKTQPTLSALLRTASGCQLENLSVRFANQEALESPVVLKLPNLQPDVFEQILRYLYTNQVSFSTVDSTLRLLRPCQIYHLPQLASRCLSHISKHVNRSNVLTVLSHLLCPEDFTLSVNECHDNDNERNELVFKCFLIVDRHADEVLQSETFETIEHELMVEIIKRDTIEVSSEAVVFDSVMRWACRACKKQRKELTAENKCSVLGRALYLVRYLVMTPAEFLRGPVSQGVLGKEDKELFLTRLSNDVASPDPLPDRWNGWKISVKRQRCQSCLLPVTSPHSDLPSTPVETSVSPTNSIQPVNAKRSERKKKSMSKKLLNGVGDLVICVIQLLD